MVPLPEWEKQGMRAAVIESGMAVIEDGFVYVRGAKEQFAWLDQKSQAGKNGAKMSNIKRWSKKQAEMPSVDFIKESRQRESTGVNGDQRKNSGPDSPQLPPPVVETIEELSQRESTAINGDQPLSIKNTKNTTTTEPAAPLGDQTREAYRVWTETLASFDVPPRPIAPVQENSLGRAIRSLGFENVLLALEGQRYEQPNKTFDPRRHLSIDRVLHKDSFGKSRWQEFSNMAAAEQARAETHEKARQDAEATP